MPADAIVPEDILAARIRFPSAAGAGQATSSGDRGLGLRYTSSPETHGPQNLERAVPAPAESPALLAGGEDVALMGGEQKRRLRLAHQIVEGLRSDLADRLFAAACYGSVAHGTADANSDLELILLADPSVAPVTAHRIADGIQVEYDIVPLERMLRAATRVTPEWGEEADAYLHPLVLWDPHTLFSRVCEAARAVPPEAFAHALAESWWSAREYAAKLHGARMRSDRAGFAFTAFAFARLSALRMALVRQTPFSSTRTMWREAASWMPELASLIEALARGEHDLAARAAEAVQEALDVFGRPSDPAIAHVIPK